MNSKSSVVLVECLELLHSEFSTPHRVVRNVTAGVTVTHEDEAFYNYVYYPLQIRQKGSLDNLDYGLSVQIGDLGGLLQDELDLIAINDGFGEKPVCKFRQYRSDDLTTIVNGPLILEVNELGFTKEGAQFEPVAPYRNVSSTGRLYTITDFPMIKGLL